MLLALTIIAAGMIIGTAAKAVEVEEYRQVMGQGVDHSDVNYGRCNHVQDCDQCFDCLTCSGKYCQSINGEVKACHCT